MNTEDTEVVSEKTKSFKCELCSKEFSHNKYLKQHVIHVHEGVKFKCDKCVKEFSSKVHLKNHQNYVHDDKGYTCDQCEKTFITKDRL